MVLRYSRHDLCSPGRVLSSSLHLWVFWKTRLMHFMSQKVRVSETGLGFAIRTQTPFNAFWVLVSLLTGETRG